MDLFCDPDPGYEVYPYFALLRILLSLAESEFTISFAELECFVLPTMSYGECDDRAALIKEFRKSPAQRRREITSFFQDTYIGRIGQLLELSPYLVIASDSVAVRASHLDKARDLLGQYEELEAGGLVPHYSGDPERYLAMLRSSETMFEFCRGSE